MRKEILFSVLFAGLAAFVALGISQAAGTEMGQKLSLKLEAYGSAKTTASGEARFELSRNGDGLHYDIDVKELKDVRMAHIHEFKDGKPGGIIAWLYPAPGSKPYEWTGTFSGSLGAGVLTRDRIEGPAAGKTVKDLFEMLEHGGAVVAIHTKANHDGELAGLARSAKKETKGGY